MINCLPRFIWIVFNMYYIHELLLKEPDEEPDENKIINAWA